MSKSIARPTHNIEAVDGPIVHPAWCDPTECGEDRGPSGLLATYHWSAEDTWRSVGGGVTATVELSRTDTYGRGPDGSTAAHLTSTGIDQTVPVDQIEALGAWLIAKGAEVRETIATEGGARTRPDAGMWLDFSGGTDADRALIASLTPAELAICAAAAKEAAEAKAAEIRARR